VLLAYAAVLTAAMLVIGAHLLAGRPWAHAQVARRAMPDHLLGPLGAWLLGSGLVMVVLVMWLRRRRAALLTVLTSLLLWNLYGWGLMPALDPYSSASAVMQRAGERIGPQAELGAVAWREQNLLQADRPVTDFGFKRDWNDQWHSAAPWLAQAPHSRWLLVAEPALSPCVDRTQSVSIGSANRNVWWLVPGTALDMQCHATVVGGEPLGDDAD